MLEFTKAVSRTKWRHAERWRVAGKQTRHGVRVPEHGSTSRFESESNSRGAVLARLLILLLLALAVPRADYAQVLYGSLTGNVTDPAGAIVSGAKVEALNINTGVSKIVNTDDRGVYLFSDLQPGVYKVTIEATSFKSQVQEGVRVDANTVRRIDAQLQTSGVSESIVVTASSATLQTDRADINITQPTRQVNDLPITGSVGRNYQSLMGLVPGAVLQGEQNSAAGSPQRSISFNVNGVSRLQNNTRIDGSSVIYPWLPTNTAYVPPAEGIQTVNIVTNSFDAEQGLAGGAAINVIIKSGTNEFHGAGWVYDTNSALRARNFFQTTPQNPKDILVQFGYAVGGPIIKNKLFFFTDLERTTRRNTSRTNTISIVPASLRPTSQGGVDFSGTGVTIYDPDSNPDPRLRTPFPGNVIPANRIDQAARELIDRLPLPTGPGFINNFVANGVALFNRTNIDTKINYNISDRFTLFGRYSISPTNIVEPPLLGEAGGDALNGGQNGTAPGRVQIAGAGITYTFSPTVILDANVGYTRQRLGAENFDLDSNFGLDVLKIPGTNGGDRLQGGIPSFQFTGTWANLGNPNTGNPFLFRDNQYVATANLSWLKGAHGLRFGVDYQNQQINHFQPQGGTFQTVRGTFQFNGNSTRLQNGPAPADIRYNAWADFLLGLPAAAGKVDQLRNPNSLRLKSYAFYARDHWQATRNLTLTYGLRWERYPFPDKDNTGINRFDPATGNVITGGLEGVPRDTGAASGVGQFLPRIGIAYRLDEKTVLRGGYGQSADPRPFIDFRNAYPIVNAWAMPQRLFNGATNAFLPVTTFRQGLINTSVPPDLTKGVLKLPSNTGTTTYPDTPMRKEIHSFNVIVERELTSRFTAQIGYVGTRAVGQMGFININAGAPGTGNAGRALFPQFGLTADINEIIPYKTTTYDALQSELKGRFGSSLLGVVYTFSKAINYADNDANPRIQYMPEAERNRGLASYDRTHNFQSYGVYDLPFGHGRRWLNDGFASYLLGGFQLNGILSRTSGAPFYVVQGNGGNLNAGGSQQVPDQIKSQVKILGGIGTGNPYFDTTAYAAVNIPAGQPQRFGNAGRNNLRGPGFFNVDLSLFRTISLTERFRLQIRAEALNALNHPNFSNPGADVSSAAAFGFITSTTGIGERNIRLGARLSF
ncbi:MAG TPA: TonB-dependent receptor [Blastocatellia bacterium]|nr:TonB-dependent receptor [Blastocatellia bacterium]